MRKAMVLFVVATASLAQQKTMSMDFTTSALGTVRCVDAGPDERNTRGCEAAMNHTQDLARSRDEMNAVHAIALLGAAEASLQVTLEAKVNDAEVEWSLNQTMASIDEKAAASRSIIDRVYKSPESLRLFARNHACAMELDRALRLGRMTKLSSCSAASSR